ncbi:aminotransferase class I/II-fold pyridoxal phosphate-dependent enzyme [Maridesulfovibrio bastinii]|uniref:aminotransferase class I/II-fold pyridoxal phosphate-dependent enzyme n=1 Tax=Maridesulfovibrio bastinii TaxID=47157 RepID=UPI000411CA13|nr:aminotransferase class I/II-fold pyridoxal phosphate-dependent enzyme [Maridesulfovibrio bastinii]
MEKLDNFKLETFFSKWEFKARYHLCASDAESMSIRELLQNSGTDPEALLDLKLGYTETFGNPELRTEISKLYDKGTADNILCFCGAEEGIFCAMNALLEPDDHVVVITPNYQSLETIPGSICSVSAVSLDPHDNWNLDLEKVEAAIRDNTKLLVINFPHNPTGKIIPQSTQKKLVEMARKKGIYIFSDEVYRLLEHSQEKRLPQMADIYEKGLSLNVLSKAYGLPGLRMGWIACQDTTLLQKMERVKHFLSICNSAPSEFIAMAALKSRNAITERLRTLLDKNLSVLNSFFKKHSTLFNWQQPDGGCTAFPCYLGPEGTETFTAELLKKTGVLLLPPSVYYSNAAGRGYEGFRIGFGRADMSEALSIVDSYLDTNKY